MRTPAGADHTYWTEVLSTGGATTIPRWTLDPVPGVAVHETPVPMAARRLDLPAHTLLLAAHAKVVAALSGDSEVVIGYATHGRVLPCRLSTEPATWRDLLRATARAETELLRHQGFPVDRLADESGLRGPVYETVVGGTDLPDGAVLLVSRTESRLRVTYRTDALSAGAAARIAGYHATALALLAADPDVEHGRQSLLSADEWRCQLEGLAGRHRPLPDARCHELFEERVRAHPDRVAAVHGARQVTYGELNARANRLARALVARGVRREDVVAVVTERNLDWLAAVLAVFKAGGGYLPIEPHFPVDRITATLSRAGCRLVLAERGGSDTLAAAVRRLPEVRTLFVADAWAEQADGSDLGVEVLPDQLAYIYFTSGSTGEPKGAMCEHAGLLNHLFAKIGDLDVEAGQVVAQTAPQCFDISLWQLVSALLVGGRTLIVPQDVILDVERFVDTIVAEHVAVLQVVPSYLDVVASALEQRPRRLPDLRCVSVTGEACKRELAQRWFTVQPGVALVNAYGLTETSDDTNHEVMRAAPDRVSLGRPIHNVRVYVVDEHLMPVPLGAPGEIVFSGVCVGRGYVNDPERTKRAFLADPHRPGERLYRGGDHGRWLPDGKLDFLGRRDNQVKVAGFRIEIGEVENALLRVPGVRDGAVVVAGDERGKRLVAWYSGPAPLDPALLRDSTAESLPAYMVPAAWRWRETLPLTGNGKIDRKALTALTAEVDTALDAGGPRRDPPSTPTEVRMAQAWAKVLGVPVAQLGRRDHFFDRGGTSLSAVKLAIALRRAVSLKDVTRNPVLADLAAVLDGHHRARAGLLQQLSTLDGPRLLVCFPYAGGNAVNFRPLAAALRDRDKDSGLAVYGVELPGHDLAAEREPFAPLEQVVAQVVREVAEREPAEVLLWGHSSGTAFALATALALRGKDIEVGRVFLAAQLPGVPADRLTAAGLLASRDPADIAAELAGDSGYPALADLDGDRAELVGSAYRHDCVGAHRYLAAALAAPRVTLSAPVTVVVAADDPITAGYADRYRDWHLLAERVDLAALTGGGHHFIRTRPDEAAQVVLRTTELPAH